MRAPSADAYAWRGWTPRMEVPECSICLESFEAADEIVLLPCRHMLHRQCLLEWTQARMISATCPLCKASLLPEGLVIEDDCELRCCQTLGRALSGSRLFPAESHSRANASAML